MDVQNIQKYENYNENMNLEALTQPITKVNYSKEREFGKGAWGELTGYTLNTPCFMIP